MIVSRENLVVTLRIIDEVVFTLIRLEAWRRHGIRRLNELKGLHKEAWSQGIL